MTSTERDVVERITESLDGFDPGDDVDEAQYWCSELSMQDAIDAKSEILRLRSEIKALRDALTNATEAIELAKRELERSEHDTESVYYNSPTLNVALGAALAALSKAGGQDV